MITYSNKINFVSECLDNSVYRPTHWGGGSEEQAIPWLKKLVRAKKVIKVGKISDKYDILTVERKKNPLLEIRQK